MKSARILGLARHFFPVYTELSIGEGLPKLRAVRAAMTRNDPELHSPQREAAIFYGMFLRGRSADELRREIDVSPKLLQKWMRARDFDPGFLADLRRIYVYRKQVLAIFDSLVTTEKTSRKHQ